MIWSGFLIGAVFGALLFLAGLANPDKMIGALRLRDFHAMRVIAMFILDWRLALVANVVLPILFTISMLFRAKVRATYRGDWEVWVADEPLVMTLVIVFLLVHRQIVEVVAQLAIRPGLEPLAAGRRLDQQAVRLSDDLAVHRVGVVLIDDSAWLVVRRYDLTIDA